MSRSLQTHSTSLDFVQSLFQNSSPSWVLSFSKKFWKQHSEITFITMLRSVQVMLESELISEENEVITCSSPVLSDTFYQYDLCCTAWVSYHTRQAISLRRRVEFKEIKVNPLFEWVIINGPLFSSSSRSRVSKLQGCQVD